ncbi:ATP-binding protein [uncultured Thiodictyon sp.]|uniref:ATP-binding protein n=1 Tax=uncultured Thiodictyon sp. TaxID=1846217 RepID=UPI0025DF9D53|nr:ATP-binding protein [uncultured Thiodictyon sp.]
MSARSRLAAATPRRLAALMLGGAFALLGSVFALWTWQDDAETQRHARDNLDATALLLEEYVLRSLAGIDGALRNADDLARETGVAQLRSETVYRRLRALARLLPDSGVIFIYDRQGEAVAASSTYPPPHVNAADRDYFRHLLAGGAEPYIGRALNGTTAHRPFFPVARTIHGPDGGVAGVAQVGVEVDYLASLVRHADLTAGIQVGLYRFADGALVARHPMTDARLGEAVGMEPYLGAVGADGAHWSGWVATGPSAADRRLVAARHVNGWPLVLVAEQSEQGVLAPARERLVRRTAALAVSAAILAGLGLLLMRSLAREDRSVQRQRRAEQVVRESEAQYRLLFEGNPNPMFVFDEETLGFLAVNQATVDCYGWSRAELLGMSVLDIRPPEDRELARETIERNRDVHATRIGVLRHRRRDGTVRDMEIAASAIDFAGRRGRLCSINDITERQRAAAALREADRRKDAFLATLAHELRNPLAPIRNAVAVLRADPHAPAAMEMIERQLRQMVRLIDDLLDVGRITRGRLELRLERVDLGAVLDDALAAAQPHIELGGHRLELMLPRRPIALQADPVRLTQVFTNLIHNACKYSEPGGHIQVRAEREGDAVAVRIKDSGIGIAPADLPAVFEMFAQVGTPPGQASGGLGIGLALARGLVVMHGGDITAHSDGLGRGSEFCVRLPILSVAPTAAAPVTEPVAPVTPAPPLLILVVDDNRDSADSLAVLLRLNGYQVETAYDGLTAVAAAAQYRPELVLLDLGLPDLDGYAVCRQIRAEPWGAAMPILAMTGWGQEADRRKSRAAGFSAHLVKPLDPADLLKRLANLPRPAD